jgi:membrane-associated phospholipid phosphatase
VFDDPYRFELNWISRIQGNGGMGPPMIKASYLGSEVLPYDLVIVYFCLSQTAGAWLGVLYAANHWMLLVAKWGLHLPRPFWLDPNIQVLTGTGSFGMPSGHVLSAAVVWPTVAAALGRRWAMGVAVVLVLLVSYSRVYLGAHFVSDVVAAWVFAALLIWLGKRYGSWLQLEDGKVVHQDAVRVGSASGAPIEVL